MRNIEIGSDAKVFTLTRGGTEDLWSPVIYGATQQALTDAGAVNVTAYFTKLTTTQAAAITLANGTCKGQLKKIQLVVDGGFDATLTIATPEDSNTNVIVFADVGDVAELMWNGSYWKILATYNAASGDTGPAIS